MRIDFVDLPLKLSGIDLTNSTCVIFDVLRATTTMLTALVNGALEIRAFGELDEARQAFAAFVGPKLLAGELHTVKPDDFDLGNRPPEFSRERVGGRTIFLATTNGTKAVRACATARKTFVATLRNATAMGRLLAQDGADVMLVGSGVNGAAGGEDLDGIATVADAIVRARPDAEMSASLQDLIRDCSWLSNDFNRVQRLRDSPGGRNIIKVNLDADIPFVAELDRATLIATVEHGDAFATIRERVPSPSTPSQG